MAPGEPWSFRGRPFITTAASTARAHPQPLHQGGPPPGTRRWTGRWAPTPPAGQTPRRGWPRSLWMLYPLGRQRPQVAGPGHRPQPQGGGVPVPQGLLLQGGKGQHRAGHIVDKVHPHRRSWCSNISARWPAPSWPPWPTAKRASSSRLSQVSAISHYTPFLEKRQIFSPGKNL